MEEDDRPVGVLADVAERLAVARVVVAEQHRGRTELGEDIRPHPVVIGPLAGAVQKGLVRAGVEDPVRFEPAPAVGEFRVHRGHA
ncbi:hypothetical protein [Streptomyces sp. NPDC051001]|uniref:hypothetical protein n=1 Tax=Streptomyces sp. NPDC051001 TaxID=3155795 RepID=UPI003445D161